MLKVTLLNENVGKVIGEFDSEITWILTGSGYRVTDDKLPIVVLFARNYHDKFETRTFEFEGFRPYFYCPASEVTVKLPFYAKYVGEPLLDALGREVVKVETRMPSQVASKFNDSPAVRDLFSFTDMSDFLFEKRFLVDHHIKYAFKIAPDGVPYGIEVDEILNPRIVYYDIEVISPQGKFPSPLNPDFEIASIQCLDSYTDNIIVFTNGIPQTQSVDHIECNSEKELYELFLTYINDINPDLITAYNSNGFDVPYIIRRANIIGVNIDKLGRMGKCRCEYDNVYGNFNIKIGGRSSLDMLEAFKKFTVSHAQRESYALKSVIADKDLLKCPNCKGSGCDKCGNTGTVAFSYLDLGPMLEKVVSMERRYNEFIDYCRNDVIALKTINDTLGLFNFYESIRFLSGCTLDDTLFNSKIIEMLILHENIKPLPRKNHIKNDDNQIEGAYVVPPVPGVTEFCGTYDLASLYPNVVIFYDLSPDIDKVVVNTLKKTLQMREDYRAMCKKDPDNISLENIHMAIKYLNNSFYGVLCLKSFRLYDKKIAETITATGRELNHFLQRLSREKGLTIVGGDTDAVIVSPIPSVKYGLDYEKYLNEQLHIWSREHNGKVDFKLKFEKLYRRLLYKSEKPNSKIGIKKKYCGHLIWEEGKDKSELNYKGLELKRSDQSNVTRDCLHYFLNEVLINGNQQNAVEYVKTKFKEVYSGEINPFDISIPKAVRKITQNSNPWMRGIQYAKEHFNYTLAEGEKPRLLYLKNNNEISIDEDFDVSLIKSKIDFTMMADKTIRQKMESYIWSIGYDWNVVVNGQQNLGNWFK